MPSSWTACQVAAEQMLSAITAYTPAVHEPEGLPDGVTHLDTSADLVVAALLVLDADQLPGPSPSQ